MSTKKEILKLLQKEAMFTFEIKDTILKTHPDMKSGTIRQSIKRLADKREIIRISNFKIKKSFFYCIPGAEFESQKLLFYKSKNYLKNQDGRIISALFGKFYKGMIDVKTLCKIGGFKSKNESNLEKISENYFKDKPNFKIFHYQNYPFVIHKDNFEDYEGNQLKLELTSKMEHLIKNLESNQRIVRILMNWAKKVNLVGWDLVKYPAGINELINYQGILFDGFGTSYISAYLSYTKKNFPILFDVLTFRRYEEFDAQGFIRRCKYVDFSDEKKHPLGVVLCRSFSKSAQRLLKEEGCLVLTLELLFGRDLPELLIFTSKKISNLTEIPLKKVYENSIRFAAANINKDVQKLESLIRNLRGKLFEFIVAHTFALNRNYKVSLDKADREEFDIYLKDINTEEIGRIECKAYIDSPSSMDNLYKEAKKFLKKLVKLQNRIIEEKGPSFVKSTNKSKAFFICLHKSDDVVNLIENGKVREKDKEIDIIRPKKTFFHVWDRIDLTDNFKNNDHEEIRIIKKTLDLIEFCS